MMNENHENPIPEENHCEHEAGMTAASQENRSAKAHAETKEHESYAHVHVQPEPIPCSKSWLNSEIHEANDGHRISAAACWQAALVLAADR
ncbi:MAG: hypothetical protein ACLSA6_13925 [Holdemania massiliensis]